LHPEEQVNTTFGAPPAPLETKSMPPPQRPGAASRPDISMGRGAMMPPQEDGVNISQGYGDVSQRPDMRGPQSLDLQNLLQGLKPPPQSSSSSSFDLGGDDSLMSVTSLRDGGQNGVLPKRTHRRKQRSDRNVVSLDI
jgi:hypothetical protein